MHACCLLHVQSLTSSHLNALCSVVNPAQISYSDTARLPSGADLVNVTQLGPAVAVSFVVRNSGPSRIPTSQLNIQWPLNSTLTGSNYYLYITSIEVNKSSLVLILIMTVTWLLGFKYIMHWGFFFSIFVCDFSVLPIAPLLCVSNHTRFSFFFIILSVMKVSFL